MQTASISFLGPLIAGALLGLLLAAAGWLAHRRAVRRGRQQAARIAREARREAEQRREELLVSIQERSIALEEQAEQRESEIETREAALETRQREHEQVAADLESARRSLEQKLQQVERRERIAASAEEERVQLRDRARADLERIARLSVDEARAELIASIEEQARREGERVARKIEDGIRERAEREALGIVVRAMERLRVREPVESTVCFIRLPSDEMKGRIIGREGRNIRALETATGIDLIVDDTPGAILISSFDPMRREIARVAIERLVEDGRIHPARIEEVVERVEQELEQIVQDEGNQAAFALGISDLHPKLSRLVGKMKFHTHHGQNLLQHSVEVALLAGHMAAETGLDEGLARRAALLHEIGRVDDSVSGHTLLASAESVTRLGEAARVGETLRGLHPDVESRRAESILVHTANRISENRPGARKENLEIFIERLKRLEAIVSGFEGVRRVYAVKAGKELRALVDAGRLSDRDARELAGKIARRIETELAFTGQIKVSVIRETRAVEFAL